MIFYQRAWKLIQGHLVPYFLYAVVCFFVSGITFHLPRLNILRELRAATKESRAPDIKNALDIDKIKNDIPMWGFMLGTQVGLSLVIGMCLVPLALITFVLGNILEVFLIVGVLGISIIAVLSSFSLVILLFWVPWIYLEEKLEPLNVIKASILYGKSQMIPVFVHLLILQILTMLCAVACYLPVFLGLVVGMVATVYLYDDHRVRIQKLIQEKNLIETTNV